LKPTVTAFAWINVDQFILNVKTVASLQCTMLHSIAFAKTKCWRSAKAVEVANFYT